MLFQMVDTGSAGNIKSEPSSGDRSACTILDETLFNPEHEHEKTIHANIKFCSSVSVSASPQQVY